MLSKKNHNLYGLIDKTYRFGEDRMTHHNFIKFGEKKKFEERAPN